MSLEKSFKNCLEHLLHILFHIKSQSNTLNEGKNKKLFNYSLSHTNCHGIWQFFPSKKTYKNFKAKCILYIGLKFRKILIKHIHVFI